MRDCKKWFPALLIPALLLCICAGYRVMVTRDGKENQTLEAPKQVETESETGKTTEGEMQQDPVDEEEHEIAKRSVVHITVGKSAGNGLIWTISEDKFVIVSNRHLMMQEVEAEVTFCNGETIPAYALGYSSQYDIAFFYISPGDITTRLTEATQEVRKPLVIAWNERTQPGTEILQVGNLLSKEQGCYTGRIEDTIYVPEFGTQMLRTKCYAKSGMSGGGVFDHDGWLLGMITGGEASDSGMSETQMTYSIPTPLIEEEYQIVANEEKE